MSLELCWLWLLSALRWIRFFQISVERLIQIAGWLRICKTAKHRIIKASNKHLTTNLHLKVQRPHKRPTHSRHLALKSLVQNLICSSFAAAFAYTPFHWFSYLHWLSYPYSVTFHSLSWSQPKHGTHFSQSVCQSLVLYRIKRDTKHFYCFVFIFIYLYFKQKLCVCDYGSDSLI